MEYRYRITNTHKSSAQLGNCEICKKPVTEVYRQSEERRYSLGWTNEGDCFGHLSCLEAQRIEPLPFTENQLRRD